MNKDLKNNTKLSHYRIVSKIGAGGMGEVYLAEDTKLERRVAVKFLNDEFGKDADKLNRFVREAKAASALNHPNILTVYEIGETDGTNYIATEFIDGKALTHLISEDKVSLETVLDVSIQIVSALRAAHVAGIVHRDIKPDNVMIRHDGIAKVLDFGLAKLTEKPAGENLDLEAATMAKINTVPGVVMGTPNYMSPEQARGKDIDRQTDIFSFGVVLYEMLTRKLPFAGETVSDIIASILTKEPKPIAELNEFVPDDLRAIVKKSLEKDKRDRYQTADELLEDLKRLKKRIELDEELERTILPAADNQKTQILNHSTLGDDAQPTAGNSRVSVSLEKSSLNKMLTAVAGIIVIAAIGFGYWFYSKSNARQIESIAVMPFINESGNADVEYLSDGMTETLISSLSNLPNLNVKPRSSVFRYKGKDTDLQTIAKELNVQAILNGRVVQRGEDISLFVELTDISLDKVIWSETYNRKKSDLVTLQTDIARDVSSKLKSKLSGADVAKVEKTYTTNPEAYQLYLKGNFYRTKYTEEGVKKGIEYYKQAIALDPNYALAYTGMSYAYITSSEWYLPSSEAMPKAKAAALKAVELDNTLAEPYAMLANVAFFYEFNWAESERLSKRAIELDPNYSNGHHFYSIYLAGMRRNNEAVKEVKIAQTLEPFDLQINATAITIYLYANRYDDSIAQARKTLEIDPNFWQAYAFLGLAYERKKQFPEAIAALEKARSLDDNPVITGFLGYVYAAAGRKNDARRLLGELEEFSKKHFSSPLYFAYIYAGLNEKDKAIEALEKAYEQKNDISHLNVDTTFDNLKQDPRFKDLLKRMNLPE